MALPRSNANRTKTKRQKKKKKQNERNAAENFNDSLRSIFLRFAFISISLQLQTSLMRVVAIDFLHSFYLRLQRLLAATKFNEFQRQNELNKIDEANWLWICFCDAIECKRSLSRTKWHTHSHTNVCALPVCQRFPMRQKRNKMKSLKTKSVRIFLCRPQSKIVAKVTKTLTRRAHLISFRETKTSMAVRIKKINKTKNEKKMNKMKSHFV